MKRLRGVCVGAGYFSQFHYDAWRRLDDVDIVAICDHDAEKAQQYAIDFPGAGVFTDLESALNSDQLAASEVDFVDIITPPATHLELVKQVADRGIDIVCQKPLAPTFTEAEQIVKVAQDADIRLMIHDNWRFQPWYREIRKLLDSGAIGQRLFSISWTMRMGDGWGEDAYLGRQPYFRDMERFLIFETGVHFIDAFRYVAGEIDGVYAVTRQLNPVIKGEDAGTLIFEFESGAIGQWDANRYNESEDENPRYTFGDCLVEGDGGSIRLTGDGSLSIQPLGQPSRPHDYVHPTNGFAGDCVYATLLHFVDALRDAAPFETEGTDYLRTLQVQEAVYESAASGQPVRNLLGRSQL